MKKTMLTVTSLILTVTMLVTLAACGFSAASADNGSDVIDAILNAGTTQAFTDEAVPEEDIRTILQAGLAAESAINQQPWYFVAITDKDTMSEISSSGGGAGGGMPGGPQGGDMPAFSQGGDMPAFPQGSDMPAAPQGDGFPGGPQGGGFPGGPQGGAPSFMGSGSAKAGLGDSPLAIIVYMDKNTSSPDPDFDCGLAVQNMYIAASALGYGVKLVSSPTMTLNGANHDQICEKLGIDTSLSAVAVLLIGKADDAVDGVSSATTRSSLSEKTTIVG